MNKVVITLEEQDLVDLQAILLDRDQSAALDFLQARVATRIPQRGTMGCDSTRCNPYLLKPGTKRPAP